MAYTLLRQNLSSQAQQGLLADNVASLTQIMSRGSRPTKFSVDDGTVGSYVVIIIACCLRVCVCVCVCVFTRDNTERADCLCSVRHSMFSQSYVLCPHSRMSSCFFSMPSSLSICLGIRSLGLSMCIFLPSYSYISLCVHSTTKHVCTVFSLCLSHSSCS